MKLYCPKAQRARVHVGPHHGAQTRGSSVSRAASRLTARRSCTGEVSLLSTGEAARGVLGLLTYKARSCQAAGDP